MKRSVAMLLLLAMTCLGTGLAGWMHVAIEHPPHAQQTSATSSGPQIHAAINGGADEDHCLRCATLHAPLGTAARVALEVRSSLAVDRTTALAAQRIDASIPAPRGCRGPPVIQQ